MSPVVGAAEAVLGLRGARHLEGGMPCRRDEALSSRHEPRVPGPIGEVVAPVARLVGDDGHLVIDPAAEHEGLGRRRAVALGARQGAELPRLLRS